MEIFSPGPVPYPGTYQCPRCNSREVYDSEKTIGVSAMTIDVPGPVNSTIVNVDKVSAKRCRYCNTVTPYLRHPRAQAEYEARRKKDLEKKLKRVGWVATIIIALFLVGKIMFFVSNEIEMKKTRDEAAQVSASINEVSSVWKQEAQTCGLPEEVLVDKVGDIWSPRVWVYVKIDSPEEYSKFWESNRGVALDCFSKKIYGVAISTKLTLNESQLNDPGSIPMFAYYFYDGVEKDGSVYAQGVVGDNDEHLGGYLTYVDDYDEFAIS